MTYFKKITGSLFLAASLVCASVPAHAADEKIAVVDIQKVVKNSSASKDISSQIEKKRAAYQAAITKQEEELRKEDQALAKQQAILSPEAFQQKAKAFKSRVADVQKDVQSRRVKLEKAYEEAVLEVQKVVLDIVSKLAAEKGFVIAIPTSQILYAKPDMDITTEVLTRLNSRLSKVQVKITD